MKKTKHLQLGAWIAAAALLATAAVSSARADYASTMLSYNPLAYYQFNETTPSAAFNAVVNQGSLGTVANGVALPSVGKGVPGKVGNAVTFTNTGNVVGHCASYIDVPYVPGMNGNSFSIEFWVMPNSLGADATGFCPISDFNQNNYAGARVGWLFYVNNAGRWNFRMGAASGSGYTVNVVGSSGNAVVGTWQHVVATWNGTTANIYVNGNLVGSGGAAPGTTYVPNTGSFLRLGGTPLTGDLSPYMSGTDGSITYSGTIWGAGLPINQNYPPTTPAGNRGWDGSLDEVALYTNALSAATISAHYSAATTNTAGYDAQILAANPVGYWNLDDAPVSAPTSLVTLTNSGTVGSAANATAQWGVATAQAGPPYAGFASATNAVTLDGVNGYIPVNDAGGLHFNGNITMSAWVKPIKLDAIRDIIARGYADYGKETFLRISRGNGWGDGVYYEVGSADGLNAGGNSPTYGYDNVLVPIPAGDFGKWVFLVGTFDGTYWNLYRNGQLVGQLLAWDLPTTQYDFGSFDVTNNWTIGSRNNPNQSGLFFGGSIAHPAILNTALTPAQVAALYAAAQVSPIITTPLVNPGTVFQGSSVPFSVFADGTPTLNYSWTVNGSPVGSNANSYTLNNIGVGAYTVQVVVNNSYGSATSAVSFASVAAPPTISVQPVSLTRFSGEPFSFSVTAGGTAPLTYFWKQGSTVVQVGASATYSGIASSGAAGTYSVIVSNSVNTVTSSNATLTVLSIPNFYPGEVITNGPIAYWRLGESTGTVAHDYVGGHDGTYYNSQLGQPGYSSVDPDTAVTFNGLNSYVGGIDGTAAGINFTGHTNFTLEAWVKAAPGQNDQATIIAKGIGDNGTTRTEQFALDVMGGVYRFFTTRGSTLYQVQANEGPNGSWQHVVGVYDDLNTGGGGKRLYIYVNGVQENSAATPAAGLNGTQSPVSIGSKRTGNDPNYDGTFNGTIDEVAVYSYALSAAQILADFSSAYGDNTAPFVPIQPASVTNYYGLPVKLTVVAAGTVPLTYQWYHGATPVGTDSSSYLIPSLSSADVGSYHVNISNTVGNTNSVTVQVFALTAPSSPPAISGLVLHLPLKGNLTDVTGRGNNGTNVGATSYVTDGPFTTNAALHYSSDPSGGTNYVTIGVRPDLQFSSNVNFTVSYWIRLPANYTAGDLPFFCDASGATFNTGFTFAPSYGDTGLNTPTTPWPGGWALSICGSSPSTQGAGYYGDIGSINDGGWHLLTHVIDRVKGQTTYLDGAVANANLQTGGPNIASAGDITTSYPANIGQDGTGKYAEPGSADISDLGVWRKALTPLEAASIYIAGVSNHLSFAGAPPVPSSITITKASKAGNSVTLSWSASPAIAYTYSVLSRSALNTGSWSTIATGLTTTNYTDSSASTAQKFYRVTSP